MAAHVRHSPSSAHRWTACPGSLRMIDAAPPERPSPYAAEGTCAHWVLEQCLTHNRGAVDYINSTHAGHTVTEEMAAAVQLALDVVRDMVEPNDVLFIEERFDLALLNPPARLAGTADVVIYKPAAGRLLVLDYKHGQGLAVEAQGNMQMRTYALGAIVALGDVHPVREVEAIILQPRAFHPSGFVRSECLEPFELFEWSADLFAAQARTLEPDAPLAAGDHCRFCQAAGTCPALASRALAVMEQDFDVLDQPKAPTAPEALTPHQIGRVLEMADAVEKWLGAVRSHATGMLERGEPLPGWKLVDKRATRKWSAEDAATAQLTAAVGDKAFAPRKIITPAQAEKLVGKAAYREHFEALVSKESSGTTLAPAHDKRHAVTPGADFDALPAN